MDTKNKSPLVATSGCLKRKLVDKMLFVPPESSPAGVAAPKELALLYNKKSSFCLNVAMVLVTPENVELIDMPPIKLVPFKNFAPLKLIVVATKSRVTDSM